MTLQSPSPEDDLQRGHERVQSSMAKAGDAAAGDEVRETPGKPDGPGNHV